tara:strand:- start:169937 stop:170590 length:654 start_codon:yes stop_codon:yes gene_type:complete
MLKLTILTTTLFTLSTFASTVLDPHGLLNQLDNFSLKRNFQKEFVVGDYVETESEECTTDDNGDDVCGIKYNKIDVIDSSANSATLSSGFVITKNKYEEHKRNAVRYFLYEQESQIMAKANLNKSNNYYYKLNQLEIDDRDPDWAIADLAFELVIIDTDGSEFSIPLQLTVERDAPFAGQIASLSIDSPNGNFYTFFEVIGWLKQDVTKNGITSRMK